MGLLSRLAPVWQRCNLRHHARLACRHIRAGPTELRGFATRFTFATAGGALVVQRHDACTGVDCRRLVWCDGYCRTSDVPAPGRCLEQQLVSACAEVDFIQKSLVLGRQQRRSGLDPQRSAVALLQLLAALHPNARRGVVEVVVERSVGGLGLMHTVTAVSTDSWDSVQIGCGADFYAG